MGCYERTLAWLIEKYAGKFPTWLCPEQVRVLPISDKYNAYADEVAAELKKNGVDVTVDSRSEKIGFKIRAARLDKLPYMLVVGQQEESDRTVSVRSRFAGNEGVRCIYRNALQGDSYKRNPNRASRGRKSEIIGRNWRYRHILTAYYDV